MDPQSPVEGGVVAAPPRAGLCSAEGAAPRRRTIQALRGVHDAYRRAWLANNSPGSNSDLFAPDAGARCRNAAPLRVGWAARRSARSGSPPGHRPSWPGWISRGTRLRVRSDTGLVHGRSQVGRSIEKTGAVERWASTGGLLTVQHRGPGARVANHPPHVGAAHQTAASDGQARASRRSSKCASMHAPIPTPITMDHPAHHRLPDALREPGAA